MAEHSDSVRRRHPVPLDQPYYGASFPVAFTRFWRKYAVFGGRASRSEFWWWTLCGGGVAVVLLAIYIPSLLAARTRHGLHWDAGLTVTVILAAAWLIAGIVPSIALTWRRLHDANLSGAFWFLALIPSVGGLVVLVLTLLPSDERGARFDGHRG
jgi:uncharacterized membrane protein YhaH (DUF805 family)